MTFPEAPAVQAEVNALQEHVNFAFFINSLKVLLPTEKADTYNQSKEYIKKFEMELDELLKECSSDSE